VQTRRLLLLLAVVLGLALVMASLPSSRERKRPTAPGAAGTPTASAERSLAAPVNLPFRVGGAPRTRRLPTGRAAVVTVAVRLPGQVEIEDLGLSATADRFTPAQFDVLESRPGRHAVTFLPEGDEERLAVGRLEVVQAGASSRSLERPKGARAGASASGSVP
jgi:hypothetical protein